MPLNPPDITELKAIVDWVNVTQDVRELSLKHGEVHLFISRNHQSPLTQPAVAVASAAPAAVAPAPSAPAAPTPAPVAAAAAPAPAAAPAAPSAPPADTTVAEGDVVVTSPMVGIFYAAPKPGAPAFVDVGARVEAGTVLCIVEVMKLMNNVEAPVAGTVKSILVSNNEAVAYGQPMMVIEPDA